MLGVVFLLVFLTVVFAIVGVFLVWRGARQDRDERLKRRLSALGKGGTEPIVSPTILRDELMSQIPALHRWLSKLALAQRLDRLLKQADTPMRVGELLLFTLVFAAAGFAVGSWIGRSVISGVVGALAAGCLPIANVARRKRRRVKFFGEQFPDALDLMTSALRAGHAFTGAIQMVADEMPDPVAREFKDTFDEQNLGLSFKEALLNLADRVDSMDLKFFVIAMVIQRETGGNVSEILEKIGYTIRERFKVLGQLRALTAEARLSGVVLALLPIAVGLILLLINPSYILFLFRESIGHYLLGAAVLLQLVGYVWIKRIVNIEV
ncbi:MAG: type II secretion system F family protein [Candidatus Eiseniibacteriota bacterium]|nr:MAG: type II secretion system F family protein [Candidatus Eisenbacteria bacterium]